MMDREQQLVDMWSHYHYCVQTAERYRRDYTEEGAKLWDASAAAELHAIGVLVGLESERVPFGWQSV